MTERSALRPLKDHQNMNISNSGEVRALLRQIKQNDDREGKKDSAQTINELRRLLTNCSSFEELEVDWTEIANPLRSTITQFTLSAETRKAASGALSALGILSLGYFDRYLDFMGDCWNDVPSKKDERRILIIQALIHTLNCVYEKQCFFPQSTMEKLCEATMNILDSNSSVVVLTPAMELALLVSTIVPHHLFIKKYFQDTVDVAIGWLVEEGLEGLTSAKLERTKEILLAFRPLWSERMDLLLNLAKQFMEDIQPLMEEVKKECEIESIIKIKAIAGTLLLLIKICAEIGSPAAALVVKDVSGEMCTLVDDKSMIVYLSSDRISSIYGIYIEILTYCTQFQSDETKMEMLNRFINLAKSNTTSSHILMGLFVYLTKLASEKRESLSIPMCSILFGTSSIISSLDFSRLSSTELSSFCSLLKTLLNPSILSVLQYAYAAVVATLKDAVNRLLSNDQSEKERTNDEIRITTIIYALKPILILKNSLIVMLGLSPSLLDLVLLDSRLLDGRLQSMHPSLHYILLHAAYEHCKAHDNYYRTSEWLSGSSSAVLGESLSSHNLERIVRAITTLLTSDNLVLKESRIILSDWLIDVSPSILIAARSPIATLHITHLLYAIQQAVRLSPQTTSRLKEFICALDIQLNEKKGSLNAAIVRYTIEGSHSEERSIALWNHLSTDDLVESYFTATLFHDCTPSLDETTSHQFERLMNFLLKRIPPIESANPEKEDDKEKWLIPPCSSSLDIPNYWRLRLMGAAAYAIESRMTTHLGKPKDTLNAFHTEMTRIFKQTMMRTPEEDDDSSLSPHEEWFRVRLLLDFIEILDRLIYRTHTGSMQSLSHFNPSQTARHWFKTNESVCTEWFNRLYPSAMGVAYHSSAYSQVIRFGQSALTELDKKHAGKVEDPPRIVIVVLCWMVRAMIEKGDEHNIKGLKEWARSSFSNHLINWDWMDCAILAAKGRFELSIDGCVMEMERDEVQEDVKTLLQEMILLCSLKLRRIDHDLDAKLVNGDDLERCRQLTSFARVEEVKDYGDSIWNLNKGLQKTEIWLKSTIKKSELTEMRNRLGVEATTVLVMDDDGLLTGRYSALCSIARDVAMKMDKNMQGMDNPYLFIRSLSSRSIPSVEGFSLCRQREGWASRLGMGREQRLKGIYSLTNMACKLDNSKVVEDLKKGLGSNNDLLIQLEYAELKSRQLKVQGEMEHRQNFIATEMSPLLMQAYHIYSDMSMNETMSSNGSNDSSMWAESIGRTTLKMARMMEDGEMLPTDGMSKLHFVLESRREETGLDEKGSLFHLSTTLNPSIAKARYELGMHSFYMIENDVYPDTIVNILEQAQLDTSQCLLLLEAMVSSGSIQELTKKIKESVKVEMTVIERAICSPGLLSSLWQRYHSRKSAILTSCALELFAFLAQRGNEISSVRVTTAALSLLSILTKHSNVLPELVQQIGDGFRMTDERVWAGVLPQLLARLTHPIEGVRQSIVTALLKLGRTFPHATVFQLVVATRMKEIIEEDRFIDEPVTTRTFAPSQSDLIHYRCTSTLLDDMATYYPQLVEDTRVFVDELHHLNLMEEKWCFVLHQLDLDMMKRLSHIKKESEKTKAIERLSDEDKKLIITAKTDLIIGSVYRIVADLWRATQSKAEKGMEDAVRFVLTNREHVLRAIEESEEARRNGDEHGRWEAFGRLNVTLGRKASKKGGQLIDITHCIGRLVESGRQWRVPLPGQEDIPFKEITYLTKVDTTCQVLSTKTRPKKMIMRGSDGIDRAFLLKTHEDLRLDERVMQMLRVSNLMMKKMGKRDAPQYTAKTYAVTPLGPLLGLIQWVNGAIPLYTFYRKWQMRENGAVPQGKKAPDGISLKPLELFEKKMKNLLAVNKLDPKLYSDRKSWHPELLKTLHDELCSETSKDLISREMWLRSNTAAHWSKLVKTFTRSTAVMSMLGAILGLGDRHPDNLLIELTDFHIIHIDYNVCFDRGRKLRVPETVPFRLTQNIRNAFGVAGTEGLFSSSCASVLSSIRTHHSLFSLLLHPFVFDPLFDWSIRDSLGNSVSKSITHIVYGNDGRMEPKGVAASTLYAIKMKESEGILEKMSRKAMEFLDRLYCGGGGGDMATMVNDPLSKWIEMIDDLLWIIRKEEGEGEFLLEERREISKAKETMAWNGATSENGGITPVQTMIRLIPKIEEKLNAMNEECKSRNNGMKPAGLPPGLEDTVYKEETNGVASAIVGRVIKRAKGEVGGTDTVSISPQEHATQLIRSAGSRMNNALMYEGWIGWV
ncbi:smg-1 [Pristionchus pacificus]|nr:smg-1 [Pristionchus pacificus]